MVQHLQPDNGGTACGPEQSRLIHSPSKVLGRRLAFASYAARAFGALEYSARGNQPGLAGPAAGLALTTERAICARLCGGAGLEVRWKPRKLRVNGRPTPGYRKMSNHQRRGRR